MLAVFFTARNNYCWVSAQTIGCMTTVKCEQYKIRSPNSACSYRLFTWSGWPVIHWTMPHLILTTSVENVVRAVHWNTIDIWSIRDLPWVVGQVVEMRVLYNILPYPFLCHAQHQGPTLICDPGREQCRLLEWIESTPSQRYVWSQVPLLEFHLSRRQTWRDTYVGTWEFAFTLYDSWKGALIKLSK
jgi:hypothetical protein